MMIQFVAAPMIVILMTLEAPRVVIMMTLEAPRVDILMTLEAPRVDILMTLEAPRVVILMTLEVSFMLLDNIYSIGITYHHHLGSSKYFYSTMALCILCYCAECHLC
jgi:hypothetical protein